MSIAQNDPRGVTDSSAVEAHLNLLREKVFQTDTKWPHFRLLLNDMSVWADRLPDDSIVASYERTLLYGGYSLLAPLFPRHTFISIDGSPTSADARGAYNSPMVDDPRFIASVKSRRCPELATDLEDRSIDFLMIPNLVHHVADQSGLFREAYRALKPGGTLYVFEPIVRELHQIPDDYLRYTPYGLGKVLTDLGFDVGDHQLEGGPFSAVAYCWAQALEYMPEDQRKPMEDWFYNTHFAELMAYDEAHTTNLVRKHTTFPMSFSITAQRPA